MLEQEKDGKNRMREGREFMLSLITPVEWQHKGKGYWVPPTAWTNGFMMIKGITRGVGCLGANHISTTYRTPYIKQIT